MPAYAFADNHDVDRVASTIRDPAGLYPLYALLFSMPGVPSIYYGSEYAAGGKKSGGNDGPLRPEIDPLLLPITGTTDLARAIGRFAEARRRAPALRRGCYRTLAVESEGIAFLRSCHEGHVLVAVNGSAVSRSFSVAAEEFADRELADLLDPAYIRKAGTGGHVAIEVPPHWARWLSTS
jgi:glycosidase